MKKYRDNGRTPRSSPEHFDLSRLTAEDHQLLADFERRRVWFDQALERSNILHHLHTCPVCGFPTLDERGMYEVCSVCLWEDDGNEREPTRIRAPNYTSMTQERINVAGMLAEFERTHELATSVDEIARSIRAFKARRIRGEVSLDREDFANNLRNILPTRPRP